MKELDKQEDQVLAKVLLKWNLLTQEKLEEACKELHHLQAQGEVCTLGQILIKKRWIQISEYTKAMQIVRQYVPTSGSKSGFSKKIQNICSPTALMEPAKPHPSSDEMEITKKKIPVTIASLKPQHKPETLVTDMQHTQKKTKEESLKEGKASSHKVMQNTQKKGSSEESYETKPISEKETISQSAHEKKTGLGKIFGSYEIICEIARGGMGIVYKARQFPLNRIVALKVLLSGGAASDVEIERFRREAEAAGALQHPNIVSIYEIGEHEGYHYFTMDFIDGETMQSMIKKKVKGKKILRILQKVALALEHAHQKGIIHRDIKPSNILVSSEGEPKITDFGLAKKLDSDKMLTESGAALGTPFYMAPEQTLGSRDVDKRVDIYAMGVILYEILTNRLPFTADTLVDLYRKIVEEDPIAPSKIAHKVDKELETICLKAMEKDPNHRYQTAQEFADDLERYLSGKAISAKRAGVFSRLQRKIKRFYQSILVMGGILGVIISVILFLVLKSKEMTEHDKALEKAKSLLAEGQFLMNEDKFEKGMEKWENAIRTAPHFIEPYLARGDAYQKKNQYSNAISEYDRIVKIEKKDSKYYALAHYKMGECYGNLDLDKAIEHYTIALLAQDEKKRPTLDDKIRVEAYKGRAEAYKKRNRDKEDAIKAINDFEEEARLRKKLKQ